jgi:hypothetical protein
MTRPSLSSWASLTSLSRRGPGPRNLAASTTNGLTMTVPLVRYRVVRTSIVISERRLVAEYRTWTRESKTSVRLRIQTGQNEAMAGLGMMAEFQVSTA